MHQLLLLRHAKSSHDDAALADRARPLSARGHQAAAAMREAMQSLGLAPDLVLVSTARRTMETLEGLSPWEDMPLIEPTERLYMASGQEILGLVREVAETVRSLMVIGHNPGLHEFALALAGAEGNGGDPTALERLHEGYPAGALTEFMLAGPWQGLRADGGQLMRFLAPRDLAERVG